jgi:hypothetical protein
MGMRVPGVSLYVPVLLSYEEICHIGLGAILRASFDLIASSNVITF